ncbi:unnamed protein product [Brachionus calyciflorus]|uniref:Uncharacterized protein n=1 Tax=Brachionus calyciflorus TaxID=104777 RepID=A0A814A3T4_9BILA|nr:unnamed protein product [Brachionus calyciflorus]
MLKTTFNEKTLEDQTSEKPKFDLNLTIDKTNLDFILAHELAHCLRDQDTEKFIYIYDFKIPDSFDSKRLENLKETSRYLSELKHADFEKICNDLNCEMESRIVKNEEYFSKLDTKDRIKYENVALAKKFLDDSDTETSNFNLPKLTNSNRQQLSTVSSMSRDGFVTNQRYQTYKDNKRNEKQLTDCYDEVYTVKIDDDESDVESDEKYDKNSISSSASSYGSLQSIKNSDHVVIEMPDAEEEDDDYSSYLRNIKNENKYEQEAELLKKFENECKKGTNSLTTIEPSSATRSAMAYKLMAKCKTDRNRLETCKNEDKMKDDFNKTCEYENDSDTSPSMDSSQFILNDVLSKLTEKNIKTTSSSSLQFNNYNFDRFLNNNNNESKILISKDEIRTTRDYGSILNEGSKLICKNDNLDSHGSSMTNSSKHEDDEEEKDEDFDQYFTRKETDKTFNKNDSSYYGANNLEKTIEELSNQHVNDTKKSYSQIDSFETTNKNNILVNKYQSNPTSSGLTLKYPHYKYDINSQETQQLKKSTDLNENSLKNTSTSKSKKTTTNLKKNQQKNSKNQSDPNSNVYSKHYTEDVDTLLQFITSTTSQQQQKTKSKRTNTDTNNPIGVAPTAASAAPQQPNTTSNNALKKSKKSESDSKRKSSIEEEKQRDKSEESTHKKNQETIIQSSKTQNEEPIIQEQKVITELQEPKFESNTEIYNIINEIYQEQPPETEFVTVIKGKKVKKDFKEQKESSILQDPIPKNESTNKSESNFKNLIKKPKPMNKIVDKPVTLTKKESILEKKLVVAEFLPTEFISPKEEIKKEDEIAIIKNDIDTKKEKTNENLNENLDLQEKTQTEEVDKIEPNKKEILTLNNSFELKSESPNNNPKIIKKSMSISNSKKTPVVFLDEIHMKKSQSFSYPIDIKFGSINLSEEEKCDKTQNDEITFTIDNQLQELNQPHPNTDTDQTILVENSSTKKKIKSKRNKSSRIASKQLDFIQNNFSSNSSVIPSSSCDESEKVSSGSSKKKSLKKKKLSRKKPTEEMANSEENNTSTTNNNKIDESFQNQSNYSLQQYQVPYLLYDPTTGLSFAYIPVINPINYTQPQQQQLQVNPENININLNKSINIYNHYHQQMDLSMYPQYNFQYNQNYSAMPMTYPYWYPPNNENLNQNLPIYNTTNNINNQLINQSFNKPENVQENVRLGQSREFPQAYNHQHQQLQQNYPHQNYQYASYPSFSHLNNNQIHRTNSFNLTNSNNATYANNGNEMSNQQFMNSQENSQIINKNSNVPMNNSKFSKNPRYRNNQ